jgi:hypothetical protein
MRVLENVHQQITPAQSYSWRPNAAAESCKTSIDMDLNKRCAIISTTYERQRPRGSNFASSNSRCVSIGTSSGTHALSQLAQECCRWWEGRNSILIHVNDSGLGETAQRILRRHDPDEIIALGNISETIIEAVDRIVYPFVFSQRTHLRNPISSGDFQLQTIGSLPSRANLVGRNDSLFSDDLPTLLLFAFAPECPAAVQHCVSLNFGLYSYIIRHQDGRPDFGLASRLWKDLPHRIYLLNNVDDFASALDEIAGDFRKPGLRFVSPMQLAEGRTDRRQHWPVDDRYQVFVGDSFEDADLFWHQPIVDGVWRLCSRFRFYLPALLARDAKLKLPLQKWLRRLTNAGSSNHRPPLFVSKSLSRGDVQTLVDNLLRDNKLGISQATAEHFDGVQFAADSDESEPPVSFTQLERLEPVDLSAVKATGGTLRVNPPEILADRSEHSRWMADIFLEMLPQKGLEPRRDFIWRLPNARGQLSMTSMFRRPARIMLNGYPSVEVGGLRPNITVRVPQPFSIFRTLIHGERSYNFTTDLRRGIPAPASAAFKVRISDKGQRYRGTLDLFSSLGIAAHYFESVLWRQIFRDLASEKASTDRALADRIEGVLSKIYRSGEPTQHEQALRRIMDNIQGRSKEVHFTLDQMKEKLSMLRDGSPPFPTKQHIADSVTRQYDELCPYNDQTIQQGLTSLMARDVIHAGLEFTCRHCGSVSWLPLGRAAQHGECPDCGTRWAARAEMPWQYRLNALAKRAVQRSGGAIPVLLAIWNLFEESKGSFLWHPNLEIYRPDHRAGEEPWHEMDIICLVDGRFTIGEVKEDIANFADPDFNDLGDICEAIEPDVALLVFLTGDYSPNTRFAENFANLQSRLSPGTKLEWRKIPSGW